MAIYVRILHIDSMEMIIIIRIHDLMCQKPNVFSLQSIDLVIYQIVISKYVRNVIYEMVKAIIAQRWVESGQLAMLQVPWWWW